MIVANVLTACAVKVEYTRSMISLIVAMTTNNVIGKSNDLPWYLPADLRRFKRLTVGHTVIMGHATFDSIMKRLGRPLPGRRNIVLTRKTIAPIEGVQFAQSLDEALKMAGRDCFIIGGAQVFKESLPLADELLVTEIKATIEGDRFFPEIDPARWRQIAREEYSADGSEYNFAFVTYKKT